MATKKRKPFAAKELRQIEGALQALRRRLVDDLHQKLGNVQNTSREDPSELLDMASSGEIDYMSAVSAEAGSATLDEIDEALVKIEQGTYGTCEHCCKPIKKRRLKARPFATLCIACKEIEERQGYIEPATEISTRHDVDVTVDLTGRDGDSRETSFQDAFREVEDVEMSGFF